LIDKFISWPTATEAVPGSIIELVTSIRLAPLPTMTSCNDPVTVFRLDRSLDEKLYNPTKKEADFFKSHTGITDDAELKQHIISVQTEAYKVLTSSYH
jgi:hypothetical protein